MTGTRQLGGSVSRTRRRQTFAEIGATLQAGPPVRSEPLQKHRAEAVWHLSHALGGITSTMKAVIGGHKASSPFVQETVAWVSQGMERFKAVEEEVVPALLEPSEPLPVATTAVSDSDEEDDNNVLPLEHSMVDKLCDAVESLTEALRHLASGTPGGSADVLRWCFFADAHISEALRLIPEDEFRQAVKAVWNREVVPVRLR